MSISPDFRNVCSVRKGWKPSAVLYASTVGTYFVLTQVGAYTIWVILQGENSNRHCVLGSLHRMISRERTCFIQCTTINTWCPHASCVWRLLLKIERVGVILTWTVVYVPPGRWLALQRSSSFFLRKRQRIVADYRVLISATECIILIVNMRLMNRTWCSNKLLSFIRWWSKICCFSYYLVISLRLICCWTQTLFLLLIMNFSPWTVGGLNKTILQIILKCYSFVGLWLTFIYRVLPWSQSIFSWWFHLLTWTQSLSKIVVIFKLFLVVHINLVLFFYHFFHTL